jgi:hypothetical protein
MFLSDDSNPFGEKELNILHFIRTSPSRVSIKKIRESLLYNVKEVNSALKILLEQNLIRQDSRDIVSWDNEYATFFTEPSKRDKIDYLLHLNTSFYSRLLRVFLCHSSDDKPSVRCLYRKLLVDNVDPWLDEAKLLPGQNWQQEIRKAVHISDVVIVCLSRKSINKVGYVQKEIKYALDVADEQPEGTIFLIPLRLEECKVPERLEHCQWVNYFEDNGYEKLIKALRIRAKTLGVGGPIDSL